MTTHKDILHAQVANLRKVTQSHVPTSPYVTMAFFQVHGANMGLSIADINTWANEEMERLKQITLDNLPASKPEPVIHDQVKLITHHSKEFEKVLTSHAPEGAHVATAFFQLQGAMIGFNTAELYPWALEQAERLHQIALDKL